MIREEGCVFCEISDHKKYAPIVYEDEKIIAILSHKPTTKGHTVIICKDHYVNLFDTPTELAQEMLAVIKKIAPGIVKAMKTDSYVLGMNNGPATKNHVDHTHMHIIARHFDDGLSKWPKVHCEKDEIEKVKDEIIKFI